MKNAVTSITHTLYVNRQKIFLFLYDIVIIQLAGLAALWIRHEFIFSAIREDYIVNFLHYTVINTVVTLFLFYVFRLYNSIWLYAGSDELINIFIACVLSGIEQLIEKSILDVFMPKSFYFLYIVCLLVGTAGIRVFYRLLRWFNRAINNYTSGDYKRLMVVGAGESGRMIVREIMDSEHINGRVMCCVDDDPSKQGKYICGVKVVGGKECIPETVKKYEITEIIIAMPSSSPKAIKDIIGFCNVAGCKTKILPGVYQFINGDIKVSRLRDVEIEDLLGRDPIHIDLDDIVGYVTNKTVLVTGGGGSIGSELCRQIATYKPSRLIIVDIYENNAYEIQQELLRNAPELDVVTLIASVRDEKRMDDIFKNYHPDIVYHAAAHKHVPLMEASPNEAIKNNVFGTYYTAKAAGENGVKRFVLISSDKAVNPVNIMGASKRICEMIVQTMNNKYDTEFVAVRFGNVLGSNGSVIPLFKKQIQFGGPVTVTHKDIIRYFMTIPEAVALMLQAGAYAKGGEIFILDMGDPVRIDELARNLIRLYGYTPDVDIQIAYTGLRPGEKLFEEMLMAEEGLRTTKNKLIHIAKAINFNEETFLDKLTLLKGYVENNDEQIRFKVMDIVDTYKLTDDMANSGYTYAMLRKEQNNISTDGCKAC